ncbi:hypothetical protein ACX80L_06955 [Arthrobacter sp. MDT1-48-3]
MTDNEPNVRRQFRVRKDDGQFWNMNFTNAGLRWERVDTGFDTPVPDAGIFPPPSGSTSAASIISEVANTAANIGMWWETRQRRLLNEAMNDETRRLPWLAEMVARWGDAHRVGDQLDLRVSEYLARETREMMDAIVANKRVALPQSVLYELEMIQDTLRSFRSLIVSQFEALSCSTRIDLAGAVRSALPSSHLDMEFIRSLGQDPAVEWAERVRTKTTGEFELELAQALRHPPTFFSRVFPSSAHETSQTSEQEKALRVVDRLVGLLAPALPRLLATDPRSDGSERRDAFRELSLFPAEVARVKALNSAWLATSAIVEANSDRRMHVQVSDRGIQVELASAHSMRQLSSS